MTKRKNTGRPKKLSEVKRSERVVAMLTPEEKEWFKQYSGKSSLSEAVRNAISLLYKTSSATEEGDRLLELGTPQEIAKESTEGEVKFPVAIKASLTRRDGEYVFDGSVYGAITASAHVAVKAEVIKQALGELGPFWKALQ